MAVPVYTTDLSTQVINTCDSNTTPQVWTNIGTGADATEVDYFIQGSACISKAFNITTGGLYVTTSGHTITSGQCYWAWYYFGCPNALLAEASGGLQALIGASVSSYDGWDVLGNDTYTYGGWRCIPIDPNNVGFDDRVGAGATSFTIFGVYCRTSAGIGKGNPLGIDIIKYGRGEMRIVSGSSADGYATFSGYATENDNSSNRWGLFQSIDGGYLWQGLMILGYGGLTEFTDSNKNILIANTKKVQSSFNTIDIRNASSIVNWTGIQISALGTVAPGVLTVTDDADVNFTNCTFNDMGTHTYKSQSTLINTTFRRCGLVTQGSAVITSCRFEDATGTVALLSNNPAAITGSTFVSDGTGHAIEISVAGEYSLTNCTFTGYAATGTPGTSGNEVIYNNSSGNVIINASGCVGTITYKNGTSATTTVNQTITLTLTGLVTGSDIVILDAGTTTERVNVDSNAGTTYGYGYADSGSSIDIGVFKAGYVPFYIRAYTLAATAASLPCAQVLDRNYLE